MDLSNIPISGNWKEIAELLNDNFNKIASGLGSNEDNPGGDGYVLPTATSYVLGGIKIGYTENDKNYPVLLDQNSKAYVNVPWYDTNTTYNNATSTSAGLMSAEDKTKLDSISEGGEGPEIIVDSSLSTTSINPVQNKVISESINQLSTLINKINSEVFPLSVSVSGGGVFEKRTTQTITVKWTVKEGNDVIVPDKITINDTQVTNTDTSKVFSDVTSNITYTIKITNNDIIIKGSTSVVFVNPSYFGVISTTTSPTEEIIKGLTKNIKNSKNYTGTVDLNNQKVCYAYPKSFGALSSIKDSNNFDYLDSYTKAEITVWDETYYVYVLTDPVTIDGFRQIYS